MEEFKTTMKVIVLTGNDYIAGCVSGIIRALSGEVYGTGGSYPCTTHYIKGEPIYWEMYVDVTILQRKQITEALKNVYPDICCFPATEV